MSRVLELGIRLSSFQFRTATVPHRTSKARCRSCTMTMASKSLSSSSSMMPLGFKRAQTSGKDIEARMA